jgi:hypothetical protein
MPDWTESLPILDPAALPAVFHSEADAARTDGKLRPGIRRYTARVERRRYHDARRQSAATRILDRLPEPGEVLHLVLDGSFDLCHLIPRVIELAGEPCDRLDLATLGFHDATVETLCRLTEAAKVRRVRLLCSHYFRSVDTDLWARAHRRLTDHGHTLYVARNHAKLQLYAFRSGRAVTLMSSANLRSCRNAESAVLFGDPETLTFWRGVVDELIAEAKKCADANRR